MKVVRVSIDSLKNERVRISSETLGEVRTVNPVPKVIVYGVNEKQFAVLIPVMPPRIGRSVSERFEDFSRRVVAPDSAFDRDAISIRSARNPHPPRTRMAATTVEPAVRPPAKAIGKIVITRQANFKSVENHFRFPVRDIIPVFVGDKEQLWRAHQPDPTTPHLNTGEHLQVVFKNRSLIGLTIPVGVFKNQNTILER